jgi:hypothetical protein
MIADQRRVLDDFGRAGAVTGTRDLQGAFDASFNGG